MSALATLETSVEGILTVRLGAQSAQVRPGEQFSIGRDADLAIEGNASVPRRFLWLSAEAGLWWLKNVAPTLGVVLTDGGGALRAELAPGERLPLVFDRVRVLFGAGTTTYELEILPETAPFGASDAAPARMPATPSARPTTSPAHVPLTPTQRQLVVALAEPLLRDGSSGRADIPGSADAAARLGWTLTAFNRKLDSVCEKLDRIGVSGLRGGRNHLATNRRLRLVEYAIATRLVTRQDLALLTS